MWSRLVAASRIVRTATPIRRCRVPSAQAAKRQAPSLAVAAEPTRYVEPVAARVRLAARPAERAVLHNHLSCRSRRWLLPHAACQHEKCAETDPPNAQAFHFSPPNGHRPKRNRPTAAGPSGRAPTPPVEMAVLHTGLAANSSSSRPISNGLAASTRRALVRAAPLASSRPVAVAAPRVRPQQSTEPE
jgi:hypothetical protein